MSENQSFETHCGEFLVSALDEESKGDLEIKLQDDDRA